MGKAEEVTAADFRVGDVIVTPRTGRPVWTVTATEPVDDSGTLWITVQREGEGAKRLPFSPSTVYLRQVSGD